MTLTAVVTGEFKKALVAAATAATADLTLPDHDLLVRYGRPGPAQLKAYHDIIAVTRVTGTIEPATLSESRRTREMSLTGEIVISIFRPGPDEDSDDGELEAGDRAYQLLSAIEEHVRVGDNITLGNLVRWCLCVDHDSDGMSDPDVLAKGRTIEVTSSWLAKARLTA